MSLTSELAIKLYSDRDETGDVTFIFGSEHIKAHRSVLAAFSPKYRAQFYGSQPDQGDVHVKDRSPTAFGEFIKFFYLEEADFTMDNIAEISMLAKESLFDRLVIECEVFLCKSMNEDNVCRIYKLAIQCDLKAVEDMCKFKIGGTYVPDLFESQDFLDSDLDTLLDILDIKFLNCTEVEVFEGCINWAGTACYQEGLDDGQSKNLRVVLTDAFPKICFKSMGLHDFVGLYNKYKGFFSAEEYVEITKSILGHSTYTNINQTLRKIQPKFQPPEEYTETDDIERSIICISAMEEYNDKSLDELRFEYYYLCRRVPRANISSINSIHQFPNYKNISNSDAKE